jgi:choline dehydrogenase-like flavoprotein
VERDINVEEVPSSMRSNSTLLFARGAEKLGHPLKPLRRNTKGCEGRSRCNFGCPHGSKLGVDMNYLPRAVAAGAQVISECNVRRVRSKGGRATGVEAFAKGPNGKRFKVSVRAKRVVVAAGGLFSPIVLQRSGIGRRSGQLGRNLTLHPGFRMMAIADDRLDGWKGALQSAYSDAYEKERITMVGLFVPPGTLAGTMKGIGPAHAAKARLAPHMAVFGGMIHDQGGGRVREVMGRTAITYRMAAEDRAQMPVTLRRTAETFFAGGAKKVVIPILGTEPMDADEFRKFDLENVPARRYECSSQHPLGSCRIGVNRQDSVVNPEGESWDLEGLYVADGSVVPSSLGVNPQLTVMALAHRIGSRLAERGVG